MVVLIKEEVVVGNVYVDVTIIVDVEVLNTGSGASNDGNVVLSKWRIQLGLQDKNISSR